MRSIHLGLVLLGVLGASPLFINEAQASRARLLVMGTGAPTVFNMGPLRGSFYYDDNHNIFYNPSFVNDFKNWATIEKSSGNTGAEGGFVASIMNFNLGVYMNRGDAATDAPFSAANLAAFRPIDLMVGADMGVKWGAGLTIGGNDGAGAADANDWQLKAGAQVSGFEPFMNYKIKGNEKTAAGETKYGAVTFGTRYRFGEWIPYALYNRTKIDPATGATTTSNNFGLGLGRNTKLTETVRMNYALSFWRAGAASRNILPIHLSLESDVLTWLALRGGFAYNLWDRTSGNTTAVSPTVGRLGATIRVAKFDFDWAVGNGATEAGVDSQTFDIANGFFTAASVTYTW